VQIGFPRFTLESMEHVLRYCDIVGKQDYIIR
jgi:hypothetical protein